MTEAEKKAKKAEADKRYREKKKAEKLAAMANSTDAPVVKEVKAKAPKEAKAPKTSSKTQPKEVVEKFTKTFGFPVRLYWNLRLEKENSSCAKAGTELEFEQINEDGEKKIYRVRRGKRNFFTSSEDLSA